MNEAPLPPGFKLIEADPPLPPGFKLVTDEQPQIHNSLAAKELPGVNARRNGSLYETPKGPAYWQGNGWLLPGVNDRQDLDQLADGPMIPQPEPRRTLKTDAELGITETPGALERFGNAAMDGFSKGYGDAPLNNIDDPNKLIPSPEGLLAKAGEAALRGMGGAVRSASHIGAQGARELGMNDSDARRLERDLVGLTDAAAMVTGGKDLSGVGQRALNRHARQASRVEDVKAFDQLGMEPFAPALTDANMQGTLSQVVGKTPVAGGPIKDAVTDSYEALGKASDKIAQQMSPGRIDTLEEGGEVIQKGLGRFAKGDQYHVPIETLGDNELSKLVVGETSKKLSFATKQEAAYENAWRKLPNRFKVNEAKNPDLVPTKNAATVIRNIERVQGKIGVSGGTLQGKFSGMAEKLRNHRSNLSIETLRHMRTEIGRMLSRGPEDAVNMDRSQLKQLYGAVTEDITQGMNRIAQRAASDRSISNSETAAAFRAVQAFKRADQFTKAGMKRIDRMLRLTKANTPERAADRLIKASLSTGQGNLGLLKAARRSLHDQEWSDVASLVFKRMGEPKASARGLTADAGFSPSSFATQWNKMTPAARQIIFGSQGKHVKDAIESIARISDRMAEFESLANHSNTFTHALSSFATGGGAVAAYSGWWLQVLVLFSTAYGYSKIVSSPTFARWISKASKIKQSPGMGKQWASHMAQLQLMADKEPDLAPFLDKIGRAQGANDEKREY